jgi:ABC-2 type transport system ATP-binding protein
MASARVLSGEGESTPVRVSGFAKSYGKVAAVREADLVVAKGEMYGLIGPDGAGKSTLMKSVAGVLAYDAGTVQVFGETVDSEESAEVIKSRIGLMPQGLGLNLSPDLSIEENIDYFARVRLVPPDELDARKDRFLKMTRLDKFRDRPMKNLSGGMKQKLGLICSLIHLPELIILDEPTTGVDPVSRRDFWAILSELSRAEGMTALISTAYMEEALRFDRVSLMHEGRFLASGTPDELTGLVPGTMVELRCPRQIESLGVLRQSYPQVEPRGEWVRLLVDTTDRERASAEAVSHLPGELQPTEVRAFAPDLEDVFIALLRQRKEEAPRDTEAQQEEAAASTAVESYEAIPEEQLQRTAIEASELTRIFGSFTAVDHVTFQVKQGEIFGLLGANGAGKSTCIKMLTGILPPSSGEGHVSGADMRFAGQEIKERIGYVSQAFSLYIDLTIMENILLYAGIYGVPKELRPERAQWVLEVSGLAGRGEDKVASLPMGLRQRLSLGCALVHQPATLFLDEPTSGVDPVGRRQFWDILYQLARQYKVAILFTTHYMSEAESCDHIVLMFAGRVVADASPEGLENNLEDEVGQLLEFTTSDPPNALDLVMQAFPEALPYGSRIRILSKDPAADERRMQEVLAAKQIEVLTVTPKPISMEEVFVHTVTSLERESEKAKGAAQ